MDSNRPEIKPDVQKEEEKKGGFLGALFSRFGGAGASGELGGLGAGANLGGWGGLGGAGLSGGLLATKAGLIALVLIGTTVASGVGFVGYKVFGPGSADRVGGPLQLFAPKPADPQAQAADAGYDGNSKSLSYVASANQSQDPGAPAAGSTVVDQSAAAAAQQAIGNGQSINANVGGNKAAALKTDKKIGELSKLGAANPGAGSAGGLYNPNANLPAKTASVGAASSMARAGSSNTRGLVGRRFSGGSSMQQAYAAKKQGQAASNMTAAGGVFDGSGASGIMSPGGGLASGGAGAGSGSPGRANPTMGTDHSERFPPALGQPGKNVTPWQSAINTAMMCMTGAALLLMFATKMAKKKQVAMAKVLCGLAALLSLVAITMGSMMSGGQYGQKFQGMMFMLAGGAMLATAAIAWMGVSDGSLTKGSPSMIMYATGGAALIATMMAFMAKPKKVDSSFFQDGSAPDWNHRGAIDRSIFRAPSQDALKTFTV